MPKKLLGSSLMVCDRILQEKDDVFSVIRLIDLFRFRTTPNVPLEQQGITITAFVQVRAEISDVGEHHIHLELMRPNGERSVLYDQKTVIATQLEGTPGGANLVFNIGVIPKQMGTHYLVLLADGEEINRAHFTLRELGTEPKK